MATIAANKTQTEKGKVAGEQKKADAPRIKTVTPDNDNGTPGAPPSGTDSSNKGKGPKGEDL